MASASLESLVVAAILPSLQPDVKDRITPMKRDDSGLFPAIVYESGLPEREMLLSGEPAEIATVQMQFTVFAKSYLLAKRLQTTLATQLGQLRGQKADGIAILSARVAGVSEQTESDTDNLYSTSLVVTIWFK